MKSISIPWAAWYGDESLNLTAPDGWDISYVGMVQWPRIQPNEILRALSSPIATKPINELAKGKKKVVILVDDLSRPTPSHEILPLLMKELTLSGIERENIRIILAVGGHRPLITQDMIKKLGQEIVTEYNVLNHHPYENLESILFSYCGEHKSVFVNRFFLEADLRISVGSIIPHGMAGFGGGSKMVVPGVAGIQTIIDTHDPELTKGWKRGIGIVEENDYRSLIEAIAAQCGLDMIVNVVVDCDREIIGVFSGDPVQAHRQGVEFARKAYSVDIPDVSFDIGIFNAYPLDTQFDQSEKAFNAYFSTEREFLKERGSIVITTAASEGRGFNSLYNPGERFNPLPRAKSKPRKKLKNKNIFIYSPNINLHYVQESCCFYLSPETRFFTEWEQVIRTLMSLHGRDCQVVIFPCASLQMVSEYTPFGDESS